MSQIDPILRALLERMQSLETTTKAIHHRMATQHSEIMSQITDLRDAVEANFAKIRNGITALDAKIQSLQLASATLSAEDQAALDQLKADSAALADAATSPVPEAPAPAPAHVAVNPTDSPTPPSQVPPTGTPAEPTPAA